jgi:hypothetical protein
MHFSSDCYSEPYTGSSPSFAAVHDIVSVFIAAGAEVESDAEVQGLIRAFLSAEVQDLIRAHLEGTATPVAEPDTSATAEPASDGARRPKKRKLEADAAPPPAAAAAAAPAAEVSWRVCCLDGTTFEAAIPDGSLVAAMKREIGALREEPHYAMELFMEGKEEPLDDEMQLLSAEGTPLFMLLRPVSDRLALEALFTSCGGAGWKRKGGWMTDAGLGEWDAVTVDAEGRVTELHLGYNNLAGPLPPELRELTSLTVLELTVAGFLIMF